MSRRTGDIGLLAETRRKSDRSEMATSVEELTVMGQAAKAAARQLARTPTQVKNQALLNIADALELNQGKLLVENERDYQAAKSGGLNEAMLDRLQLTSGRIDGMARDLRQVAALPDPVGETIETSNLPNGLRLDRRRVPWESLAAFMKAVPTLPWTLPGWR